MGDKDNRPPLPWARALPEDERPRRLTLRLDDGYETSVYVHGRGGGGLPVLYVHGIQSHPGWFVGSAAAMAAGYAVFQPTRRGSGDNAAERGHASSAGQLLADVDAACRLVRAETGVARIHLVGVSWGGKLLAAWAADPHRAEQAASLTLVAPGIVPRVDVPLRTKLAVAAALAVCPRRLFDIPLSDVELFTDNEEMRDYLRNDACRLHRATASFLLSSRRLDGALRRAPAGSLALPVTLLLADRDRIIDNAATEAVVRRLAGCALTVRHFPASHTLEFEPDAGFLYDALIEALRISAWPDEPRPPGSGEVGV